MKDTKARRLPLAAPTTTRPITLPGHGERWLEAVLGSMPAEEPRTTCEDCAMLPPDGVPFEIDGEYFSPETKCCTHSPRLANFLVGGVLADPDPAMAEGRARMEARIARGAGVSPLGVRELAREEMLMELGEAASFGRVSGMKCPFFVTGKQHNCSIWRHRNSTCMTWFCKMERGGVAIRMWEAARRFLEIAETTMARQCLVELDVPAEVVQPLIAPLGDWVKSFPATEIEGVMSESGRRRAWGPWAGREVELFRRCAEIVLPLSGEDVLRLAGPELALAERVLRSAYAKYLDRALPERVTIAPFRVARAEGDRLQVEGRPRFDALELPGNLIARLGAFDGTSTRAAIEQLVREGIAVDEETVLAMLDFGILAPA